MSAQLLKTTSFVHVKLGDAVLDLPIIWKGTKKEAVPEGACH